MYNPRTTHIWSPGIYDEMPQGQVHVPREVPVQVRSNTDPALTAAVYTRGYYDFGASPESKFRWGVGLLIGCGLVLCLTCFLTWLTTEWPQAKSTQDRLTYFYRR